jgi:hypothetical protein
MRYLYVGHHKCASAWTCRIVIDLCRAAGISVSPRLSKSRGSEDEVAAGFRFVLCDNYFDDRVDLSRLPRRGFHVIRDPRDLVISRYHSHRDSHPAAAWLAQERAILRSLPEHEGLAHVISGSMLAASLDQIARWDYEQPGILETTFERLTADPHAEWRRIVEFLELPLPEGALDSALERNTPERLAQTLPGHYRSGRAEQWRELSPELLEAFMARWGWLVEKLGYAPA